MSLYIITLYDNDWNIVKEILVKAKSLVIANKRAGKMIPPKGKVCAASADTLHTYGLHKFYQQQKKDRNNK